MTEITSSLVHPGERVDDLQREGRLLIQNPEWFCFGVDAVLLASFARVKKGERALDMGTGTGVIPILLDARYEGEHYTGLEIQEGCAEMAARSVALNRREDKISIVQGDLCKASELLGRGTFRVVTCNPPYMNENHGLQNPSEPKAIARHELLCTFEDVAREASACLAPGGRFYMIHRPRRLMDLVCTLRKYKLEPKRMCFIHPYVHKEANMVLVEASKCGGVQMHIEPPLIIYREAGEYTDRIKEIYYGKGW